MSLSFMSYLSRNRSNVQRAGFLRASFVPKYPWKSGVDQARQYFIVAYQGRQLLHGRVFRKPNHVYTPIKLFSCWLLGLSAMVFVDEMLRELQNAHLPVSGSRVAFPASLAG